MLKFLIFLLLFLFLVAPLVALLSFHEDCSKQACHMLMTNLFIATSTAIISVIFLAMRLVDKSLFPGTLRTEEIFLPPRF